MTTSHYLRALDDAICTVLFHRGPQTCDELTTQGDVYDQWARADLCGLVVHLLSYGEVYVRLASLHKRGLLDRSPRNEQGVLWWIA